MKTLNFLTHQEIFNSASAASFRPGQTALLPHGGGAYRGYCGGCPVGRFIKPRDYMTAMEGVPIRYIAKAPEADAGVYGCRRRGAQARALRSRIQRVRPDHRRTA